MQEVLLIVGVALDVDAEEGWDLARRRQRVLCNLHCSYRLRLLLLDSLGNWLVDLLCDWLSLGDDLGE
jgi:hypothetical protein